VSRIADLDGEPAIPALRAVSAARPGDWSAWFLLGDALEDAGDLAESEAAYRKAAALNDDNAPTQNNLAWVLATSGRPAEALPFARRAVELAPWDPNTVDTLALVMDGLGSCPDALRLQRRASDLLQDENDEIRAHLVDYERRCGREAQTSAEAP
jgi:Flp pilus assembly protein TadD